MAVAEQEAGTESAGGGARNTALKAAAAAAATGAATLAVRKALSHDGEGERDGAKRGEGTSRRGTSATVLSSAAASAWAAASDVVIPMAEDAAESAGKYLAEHGPEIVRERIVPRFIEAFNEAG